MQNMFSRRFATVAASLAIALLIACQATAQTKESRNGGAKKIRGRLPAHYAKIVTEEQREQIYKIQEEYKPKIDAAKAQLDALTKEQEDKIAAVLTSEQKKKLDDAVIESKEKKETKKSEKQPQNGETVAAKKSEDKKNPDGAAKPTEAK